tara:strand:- start:9234 stop:9416 length:183 start_codon:yes stop_codon:yes gene_type:complete
MGAARQGGRLAEYIKVDPGICAVAVWGRLNSNAAELLDHQKKLGLDVWARQRPGFPVVEI